MFPRLLANAYSLHIAHLTTGMRIGAAAAEKLDLFPVRAPSCSVRHRHALVPSAAAACLLLIIHPVCSCCGLDCTMQLLLACPSYPILPVSTNSPVICY